MAKARIKIKQEVEYNLKDLFEEFLEEKEADGRSYKTLESNRNSFKKFISCFGDEIQAGEVNEGTIVHYKNFLKRQELTLSSTNHYLRDLRTFINWCKDKGYVSKEVEVKLVKGQETVKDVFSDEELEVLLEKPKKTASYTDWRNWLAVNIILSTGLRLNTLVNIQVKDVDLKDGQLIIREQKNKKVTQLPIAKELRNAIKEYSKRAEEIMEDEENYLLCNIELEQLSTNGMQQSFRKYCMSRGVEMTSLHALRHTFAKKWVNNGGDTFRLQKMLGHSTLQMTRHYVNLYGADLKEGFDEYAPLNKLVKKRGGSKPHKI